MRLNAYLARAGVASRRAADQLIKDGRVVVNGEPGQLNTFVGKHDVVELDGRRLAPQRLAYVLLHKPRGYITSRTDPEERPTIYALIDDIDDWLIPVGRLDLDTSGMLLLTNDTQFAEHVTNPESHLPKTYRVEATPRLSDDALDRLRQGIVLHDGPTRSARVERFGSSGNSP